MSNLFAYCWRSGVIDIGAVVPKGAIEIARGPRKELTDFIGAVSRHAYDGETLLVPGVPEAESDVAAVQALMAFVTWLGSGQRHNGAIEVTKVRGGVQ